MITNAVSPTDAPRQHVDARDLQAHLYREIGITAVAAALRFMGQPDPGKSHIKRERDVPAVLRGDDLAA